MTIPLGLNLPGDPRYSVEEIAATGAKLVRLPLRFSFAMADFFDACHDHGIKTMLVGDSHPDSLGTDESFWPDKVIEAEFRFGHLADYYQWGNEPDANAASDSSFHMGQERLNRLNAVARRIQPTRTLVLAGLCSGRPDWLDGVDLSLVDGVAVHPYSKSPGSIELHDMLEDYLRYSRGLPICVTEYDSRTPGMSAYLANDRRLTFALVFSYHDDVSGFGLVDQQGNRRPSYFEFQQAALAAAPDDSGVPDTGGVTLAEFGFILGFKDLADQLGADVVGDPQENEHDADAFGHPARHQATSKGHMLYLKDVPGAQPVFLAGR